LFHDQRPDILRTNYDVLLFKINGRAGEMVRLRRLFVKQGKEARQGKTRQDKTRQDKTRQDKTRQDKTRQDKTRRFKTLNPEP
jgi:hypothetical protein